MQLVTIKKASEIASGYTNKEITESNISYLIQYGRINRYHKHGSTFVNVLDIENYYNVNNKKSIEWMKKLGYDLNWRLSFEEYKESQTTKHVHRLHPYKGKFIPQLVEYFLDYHIDDFKKEVYFKKGDIVLDPFCGSGTTLVQANELGIHSIGIDISEFNTLISNCKINDYDINYIKGVFKEINKKFDTFQLSVDVIGFEKELLSELYKFNSRFFPSPDYKKMVYNNLVDEREYGKEKEKRFYPTFKRLAEKYNIKINTYNQNNFINKWYFETTKKEIYFIKELVEKIKDDSTRQLMQVILSRTIRSCRATTHSDLATLTKPAYSTYYCTKHKKICKPLFSIRKWWGRYSYDTLNRIKEFKKLKTNTIQRCIVGNSIDINIAEEIESKVPDIMELYKDNGIKGIFTSPPYVGLIDYHEQHAYSYELFSFERRDDQEIGPLFSGSGVEARRSYSESLTKVLLNCKKYLSDDFEVFVVVNDKYNLYPKIAKDAGMKIIETYKRPVLNRTEKDKAAYSECIFRMKDR